MKTFLSIIIVCAFMFTSCDDDVVLNTDGTLTLSFTGLSDLGSAEMYEGWIIVDGSPVSTGTFSVDGSGSLSSSQFMVDAADLEAATAFVLSVEPSNDPDPAPSDIKILSGTFTGDDASLDLGIIADLSSISGSYILATPTSTSMADELSGVWFLDNSGPGPVAGLQLPDLSGVSGWTYEGWAVFPGASGPISTGTFDDPAMADANGGGPYMGGDAGSPPFPGDDFVTGTSAGVTFPADLSGGAVVISIEPVPDNSADPFLVKPLIGSVPAGAADHTVYNANTNLITGTASR